MANNAISFDGSTEYGMVDNFAAIDSIGTGSFTAEGWVKNTTTSDAYSPIFTIETALADTVNFTTENGVGNEGFNFSHDYDGGTSADGYESGSKFLQNTWVHWAFVFDATKKKSYIFINGVENVGYELQNTGVGNPISIAGMFLSIGRAAQDGTFFDGAIGGFLRLWNRALNGAEIYYNYDKILTPANESGLIVNCNFLEESGTVVDNDATAGEDLDLYNTPTWVAGPSVSSKSYTNSYIFRQIATSSDDAEEAASGGTPDITSSDIEIVNDGATTQQVGVRFTNITIPVGATIQAAYLRFVGDEAQSAGTQNADIYGEDADSPGTFTTSSNNITGRTETTAKVDWDAVPASVVGQIQTSPDIKTVIQEIVDRAGWASGNNMVILIEPGGSNATRTYVSYDSQPYVSAMLHVEYTAGGGTVVKDMISGFIPFAR